MGRLFGTDGVRGLANDQITAELALQLADAAARVFTQHLEPGSAQRPLAVVGRDPRASGEFLEAAVAAGLAGAGVDVIRVGVLPTPGVAYLTGHTKAHFGVMLSASHNPMPDNGIKFFAAGGHKLDDDIEDEIEAAIGHDWQRPTGEAVGRISDRPDLAEAYVQHLDSAINVSLDGLHVVADCANGAASSVGPAAYEAAGATVTAIHADPDGLNINQDCGSTHLGDLQQAVKDAGADIGLAHDGDADRCLAIDAEGNVVDGDQILAILALALKDSGHLTNNTLVTTVMSNLGLKLAMRDAGIDLVETAVGDRYVLEAMRQDNHVIGGEQSGHVVLSEFATTGDGVLTGLMLAARMAETGKSLADLAGVVHKLPQVLINVTGVDRTAVKNEAIDIAVSQATDELGETGRVLLRPSGTEPVVRVMVEAPTHDLAQEVADRLAKVVAEAIPVA